MLPLGDVDPDDELNDHPFPMTSWPLWCLFLLSEKTQTGFLYKKYLLVELYSHVDIVPPYWSVG